jgi:diguanylate cyclase (GGDEF)-like protein/PAS domain S-box-containing protein
MKCRWRGALLGFATGLLLLPPLQAQQHLVLGMFAYRPKPVLEQRYQPLADYLTEKLPDSTVELRVLELDEIEAALAANQLDLIFTNPSHYIRLRKENHLSGAVVTLLRHVQGKALATLGGVILTPVDSDIHRLANLKGRHIAIPGSRYLGGYQAQAYELMLSGIDLQKDVRLSAVGSHDGVIDSLLAGNAEAGFVRTGVLEQMSAEGKLPNGRLRVLNELHLMGFPLRVSTRLYPEWPVVALPRLNERLGRLVASALLALDEAHPAAKAAGIAGFTTPADYLPLDKLARVLHLPPYHIPAEIKLVDIWHDYRTSILLSLMGLISILIMLIALSKRNHQLGQLNTERQASENRFREMFDNMSDGVAIYAAVDQGNDFVFREHNKAGQRYARLAREETIGKRVTELFPGIGDMGLLEVFKQVWQSGEPAHFPLTHYRDGRIGQWVENYVFRLPNDEVVAIYNDVTASRQADENLRRAAMVFENAREGIMITNAIPEIIDVNEAFLNITGFQRDEVMGKNPHILSSGRHDLNFYQGMWKSLIDKGFWSGEIWNRRTDGQIYAELLTISSIRNERGEPQQYIGLFTDITAQKENESRLEHIAHYDALTGLPNRVLLADRLDQDMRHARRRLQRLALIYLDLDGFKEINDIYGHQSGDLLLIQVARNMKDALREGDTIARLGGDEFVAVLIDLSLNEDGIALFKRLLDAASRPVKIGNQHLRVSASLGVSFYPQEDDMDAEQLIRQADQAMYQAKIAGKNCYHIFDTEQDRQLRGLHEGLESIRKGLEDRQFELFHQPKVNMSSGEVIGTEALIRWNHPTRGLLLPMEFLPVIEDHPLIVELGDWVLQNAMEQIERWARQGLTLSVSVNIAARQLQQDDFIEGIRQLLARFPHIEPSRLVLEVLETSALDDLGTISDVISGCRSLGVGFALDDFGTGYSSLAYLKRLPVSQLKVDRFFVRDMLDDPDDFAILEGVIGLANAFRLEIVAEGMETAEHGAMLLQLGCELAQGFGIARPMPAAQLQGWIANWNPEPAWSAVRAVSRDKQSVLFACVEHKAWVKKVIAYLQTEAGPQPLMDHKQCRFGSWLAKEILHQSGQTDEILEEIDQLHQQIHQLASHLLAAQNENKQALQTGIEQLKATRDALLAQLRRLAGIFSL